MFKVGDEVVLVDDVSWLKRGKTYRVTAVEYYDNGKQLVSVKSYKIPDTSASRFVLASEYNKQKACEKAVKMFVGVQTEPLTEEEFKTFTPVNSDKLEFEEYNNEVVNENYNKEGVEQSINFPSGASITFTDKPIIKDSNPKDAVGVRKVPMSVLPANVLMEAALGLMEGGRKYGRHNYRAIGVRSSVYYDATMRHLMAWWEGEDIDPHSGVHHVSKAISSLIVLRDAMMNDKCTDDRPPKVANQNWIDDMNEKAAQIVDKYPDCIPAYTQKDLEKEQ